MAIPDITGLNIAQGVSDKTSNLHKFGRAIVGTTFTPIAFGGVWPTPQPANATALRIKAGGNANDAAGGSGAQEITIQGLSATGEYQTSILATAGISASDPSAETYIRKFRSYVSKAGAYPALSGAGSHDADIVIENAAGTEDWATIDATGFARGQSEIAAYSVPFNFKCYILSAVISVESTKPADVILFQREGILNAAAPYQAMRSRFGVKGIVSSFEFKPRVPLGPFLPCTDVFFMGKVGPGTGEIDVRFEILLVQV